jgi:hypothetical protein
VPAQQGLRGDEEAGPAPPRQHTRCRGQGHSIGVGELGTRDLPTEDRQLVAQHDDLEVLGTPRAEPQRHHLEDAPGQDVHKSEGSTRWMPPIGRGRWIESVALDNAAGLGRRSGGHRDTGGPASRQDNGTPQGLLIAGASLEAGVDRVADLGSVDSC